MDTNNVLAYARAVSLLFRAFICAVGGNRVVLAFYYAASTLPCCAGCNLAIMTCTIIAHSLKATCCYLHVLSYVRKSLAIMLKRFLAIRGDVARFLLPGGGGVGKKATGGGPLHSFYISHTTVRLSSLLILGSTFQCGN
jgi:hypothetical protein